MFGLSPDVIRNIKKEFSKFPQIEKVILYGSRAKGNYKDGSDIDVTLIGKNLNLKTVYALEEFLEALYLPYSFDISIFTQIDNDDLIEHILNVGKDFYIKGVDKKLHETGALSLPEGWSVKKFEACIEKVIYTKKIKQKEFLENGEFPIVSQEQDLINGFWDNSNDLFYVKNSIVIFGDHTKIIKFIDFNFVLGADGVKILQPNNNLNTRFLYYFLQNINLIDLGYARHYKLLKRINIHYPKSLKEQKRIVSILDRAFKAIDQAKTNAEQNLKNAKELFESYLQNVFENKGDDWVEKTIGGLGKPSMCKRIFKDQTSSTGEIPFYKIGTFGKKPNAFISKELYNKYKENYSFPKKGDILISASGTIGRRVVYNGEPAFFQDSNIVWIDNDENLVLNEYLYLFYGYCDWQPKKGVTIPRLYNANLKRIVISFPKSKKEQQQIVQKLDALQVETKKLESLYQQKIADLEELKKSILQKAFNGELSK